MLQALKLGVAYIIAQVLGGVVGAAAAFTSLPGVVFDFVNQYSFNNLQYS